MCKERLLAIISLRKVFVHWDLALQEFQDLRLVLFWGVQVEQFFDLVHVYLVSKDKLTQEHLAEYNAQDLTV